MLLVFTSTRRPRLGPQGSRQLHITILVLEVSYFPKVSRGYFYINIGL
jgi:hypothetical protein